jgi:protein-disulfide isomerase
VPMAATRPTVQGRPTWLKMALALGVGAVAAVVLVVGSQLLRMDNGPSGVVRNPVVDLSGIPQQGTVLGDPAAKVRLIEYADQQCPGCRYYTLNVFPSIVREYVRPGKVKVEYRGFPFIGPDSVTGLRFLLAAAKQNRLWQLQEALYRYQGKENSGWITDDLVRQLASKIPGLDVMKLLAYAQSAAITKEAAGAEQKSGNEMSRFVSTLQTPTFLIQIDGQQPYYVNVGFDVGEFRAALDDALKG